MRQGVFILLFLIQSWSFCASEPYFTLSSNEVKFGLKGRPIFLYRYRGVPYKPYVKELFSPQGVQILRDSPPGHRHHHGLMYAITVDGVNFWEEFKAPGLQRHLFFRSVNVNSPHCLGILKELLRWENPREKEALLTEERTLCVFQLKQPRAFVLTWKTSLSLPAGRSQATLTGSHYHGLGMRFVSSMDEGGEFLNETGDLGSVYRGTEKLGKALWCAYMSKAEGKWVTAVMFGHPENPRGKTLFFTMTKPFAYLSATLGLHKKPLILRAGKSLRLVYGVAVLDGKTDRKTIQNLYAAWLSKVSNLSEAPLRN